MYLECLICTEVRSTCECFTNTTKLLEPSVSSRSQPIQWSFFDPQWQLVGTCLRNKAYSFCVLPVASSQAICLRLLGIYACLYITSHIIHNFASFDAWYTSCVFCHDDFDHCPSGTEYFNVYQQYFTTGNRMNMVWCRKYILCDVYVQFLYETVFTRMAGESGTLLDE